MRTSLLGIFLGFIASATPPALAQADPPNILLIVADDMGYGDLSCYGSLQIQTPNLDRLAAAGVRCTDAYVSGPVCAPSRAGLMTGRNGSRFGFEHNLSRPASLREEYVGIPLDEPLLPQRLKKVGYRTGLVGKWHLGESVPEHHPLERGFDSFFGMLNGSHGYWPTLKKNHLWYGHEKPAEIRGEYLTDWFTLEALDFIRGEGFAASAEGENQKDRPWFLFLSYNTPHSPMQAREDDLAAVAHIPGKTRRIYAAMQHCMDRNIGLILSELEQRGELQNTLIVFLSDNGGSVEVSHAINAPLRGTKGTYLEGGIRVPMIFSWPQQWEPQVFRQPLSALDLMATFVSAAGGNPPSPGERVERAGRKKKKWPIYDSVDLDPHFRGKNNTAPHPTLYWRTALRGSAIRDGDWKLLRPNSELPQLYNLAEDVGETRNLIADEPAIAARLLEKFNKWETTLERNPMFMSDPYWLGYNRKLYERRYRLTQPAADESDAPAEANKDDGAISSRLVETNTSELVLIQEAVIHAPVDQVWAAFTTEKGWTAWASPQAKFDFRAGGALLTHYDPNAKIGDEGTNTLHILNYIPQRLLTLRADMEERWPQFMKEDAEKLMNVIVFDRVAANQTRILSYGVGYRDTTDYRQLLDFFIPANEGLLRKLKAHLEQ